MLFGITAFFFLSLCLLNGGVGGCLLDFFVYADAEDGKYVVYGL